MWADITCGHQQSSRKVIRLVLHFRRWYAVHYDMSEFMREAEPLAVSRLIPVQENAWRHVRNLNSETIHFQSRKVAMDNDAASPLYPGNEIPDWAAWRQPCAPNKFCDLLRIATIFVNVQSWKWQFWLKFSRVQ